HLPSFSASPDHVTASFRLSGNRCKKAKPLRDGENGVVLAGHAAGRDKKWSIQP
ncbi:hypothetical protein BaRGS_00014506, partial [Batillaria attramentaria]